MEKINKNIEISAYALIILGCIDVVSLIYRLIKIDTYITDSTLTPSMVTGIAIFAAVVTLIFVALEVYTGVKYLGEAKGKTGKTGYHTLNKVLFFVELILLIGYVVMVYSNGIAYEHTIIEIIEIVTFGELWYYTNQKKKLNA